MKQIATHTGPDADALCAAWLAQRFLFAGEGSEVVFVARSWTPRSRAQFSCVVDVGRAHNPARLLFDHKPPALPDRNDSCAAKLVYKYLQQQGQELSLLELPLLEPLIQVVHEGDHSPPRRPSPALVLSRSQGLHVLVRRLRTAQHSDAQVFEAARLWLDGYHNEHLLSARAIPAAFPEARC